MPDDLNSAISSAIAESTAEVTGGDTATDTTPETAPTPEPAAPAAEKGDAAPAPAKAEKAAKAAEPPPAEPDDFWTPTAEELAAIDKNPELKKVYRSMQKGLTQKSQTLADRRKELESQASVVEWIRRDPQTAIRAIAATTGVDLSTPAKATEAKVADSLEAKWSEVMGPDAAKLLRPLFEETARTILAQEVAPYKEQTERLARNAAERGVAASVREFGASIAERGDEWDDEIQGDMAKLAAKVEPGADTPIGEYLDILYDKVVATRLRTRQARTNLDRLRRIKTESEPSNTARPAPPTEERVSNEMSDRDAVAVAVRLARQSLNVR